MTSLPLNIDDFFPDDAAVMLHSKPYDSSLLYSKFELLLELCSQATTVRAATRLLHAVKRHFQTSISSDRRQLLPYSFQNKEVSGPDNRVVTLQLLTFRSTYEPGAWSRTFYEGLSRYPAAEFYDRKVVELGCGNGWICLGLALRCMPERIVGVDINSRAILCAKLNLFLNSYTDRGDLSHDSEGRSLIERIQFFESDLLEVCSPWRILFDRIIGCIPQVLNPEPATLKDILSSDEYLYSLSNYTARQGYVEDEFGLGLIAKAIEQSIKLLRPSGKLILNLGGRPGREVLERLMTRRGLEVRTIWQSVTRQDEDTSIEGLVEIERETGHQFEFFMHPYASNPICASTAKAYAAEGGELFHSVTVYEATLQFPTRLKHLFEVLSKPQYSTVRDALNLAETDPVIAEERFTVVPAILDYLDSVAALPYGATAGDAELLARLASFMHRYYLLPLQQENFLVAPSRADILSNILHLYQPALVQCSAKTYDQLPWEWRDRERLGSSLIYSPADLLLTRELLMRLKPEIVYTEFAGADAGHPEALEMLIKAAMDVGAILILDISELVELTSNPVNAAAFAYLNELGELPSNLFLLCGFIRNQAYHDLQLSWVATQVAQNITSLANAAELSYSRTPMLTQRYYTQILDELLHFLYPEAQVQEDLERVIGPSSSATSSPSITLGRSEAAVRAFAHSSITGNHLPFDDTSVRLDYGENELVIPMRLRSALMEVFLRERLAASPTGTEEALAAQMEERFGIHSEYINDTVLGSGVAELFSCLVRVLRKRQARILFPQGAYGYFEAVLHYYGLPFTVLPTSRENSFKLAVKELRSHLSQIDSSERTRERWLYLNAPVCNPSGAIYSDRELKDILAACRERGVSVVMDTVFAGLEFPGFQNRWDIEESWHSFTKDERGTNLLILGGVAKEFAAAGLRFGYAAAPRGEFLATLTQLVQPPHYTTRYGVSELLKLCQCRDSESRESLELQEHLEQQRYELARRCRMLTTTLADNGWEVLLPQGGLFLLASPAEFLGRPMKMPGETEPLLLDGNTIVRALFIHTGLAINGSSWTGIPNYCRFVLSCAQEQFDKALVRIARFKKIFDESV